MVSQDTKAQMGPGMLRTNYGKAFEKVQKNLKALDAAEPTEVTFAQMAPLGGYSIAGSPRRG